MFGFFSKEYDCDSVFKTNTSGVFDLKVRLFILFLNIVKVGFLTFYIPSGDGCIKREGDEDPTRVIRVGFEL